MSKVKLCRSITGATILVIPHPSYRIISHTRAADHYSRSGDVILPKYAQFYDKNGKIYRRTFTVGFRKLWSRCASGSIILPDRTKNLAYFGPRLHAFSQKVRLKPFEAVAKGTTANDRTNISRSNEGGHSL